jgi:transglutaminase-like putative cysteine protease/predicted small secreted protein
MKRPYKLILSIILIAGLSVAFSSCNKVEGTLNKIKGSGPTIEEAADLPARDSAPRISPVEAPGSQLKSGGGGAIDFSNAASGYVMCKYDGSNPTIKVQVTFEDQTPYTYGLTPNAGFTAFPLSQGNGSYTVSVFTNVSGDQYAQAASTSFSAQMTDEYQPFLHPNQYSNFTPESALVAKASEEAAPRKTDIGVVENIYMYVTKNVTYDHEKAATVQSGYIPNPDETLATGTGICFDYASLTSAMLRSQGIPTRLVVGYAGEAYHAWISVHVPGEGWVDGIIEFKDEDWTRMDPTFTASGDKADPNQVGDGTSYSPLYDY